MNILITANALALSHLPVSIGANATPIRLAFYILFAGLFIAVTSRATKHAGKAPYVRYGWPVLGNIVGYTRDPVSFVRKATIQYGKVFNVNMILMNTVWLRDLNLNKFYMETKEETWSFGGGMGLFLNKVVDPGYFDNLKTFVASLSRGINRKVALDRYTDIATDTSDFFLSRWAEESEISLFEHVSELVHAIVVQCLMGPDFYADNSKELYELLHGMEADIGNILNFILPEWVPHPAALRLKQRKERIGAIFFERLKEREANPEDWVDARDYISYTLHDDTTASLKGLYAAHHTLLMFAAHTSTVASISWTILELLKSPPLINSLRQDLFHDSNPQSSPHLQASLKETGRCYSGINMLRLSRQSINLPASNMGIPQGSVVSISPYLTHHDPAVYQKADQWRPERWLEEPDLAKRVNSMGQLGYMPFGAGVHRCPGEKLAGIIAAAVIGTLVEQYDITWGKRGEVETTDLDFSKIGSPWLKGDASVAIRKRTA